MPIIKVHSGPVFAAGLNQKLALALVDHGVDLLHRCGGEARCTTCRVKVLEGELTPAGEQEREILERKGYDPSQFRLSCQCRVRGDLSVEIVLTAKAAGMDAGPRPKE